MKLLYRIAAVLLVVGATFQQLGFRHEPEWKAEKVVATMQAHTFIKEGGALCFFQHVSLLAALAF